MGMETCPKCEFEETEITKAKNPYVFFRCPKCGYEWDIFAPDPELPIQYEPLLKVISEQNELEEDTDEDDPENIFNQSMAYANSAISDLLKKIIKRFDWYSINSDQLVAICNMFKVTSDYKKYIVNGYIRLDIKEIESPGNYKFQEILVDVDGLSLTKGGYVTENNDGGDSYSDLVFPIDDEDEANDTIFVIDDFVCAFLEKLDSENKDFDAFDSGDGIEETEE